MTTPANLHDLAHLADKVQDAAGCTSIASSFKQHVQALETLTRQVQHGPTNDASSLYQVIESTRDLGECLCDLISKKEKAVADAIRARADVLDLQKIHEQLLHQAKNQTKS